MLELVLTITFYSHNYQTNLPNGFRVDGRLKMNFTIVPNPSPISGPPSVNFNTYLLTSLLEALEVENLYDTANLYYTPKEQSNLLTGPIFLLESTNDVQPMQKYEFDKMGNFIRSKGVFF